MLDVIRVVADATTQVTTGGVAGSSIGVAELALAGSALTVVGVIIAAIITARRSNQPDPSPLLSLASEQGKLAAQYSDLRGDVSGLTVELGGFKEEMSTEIGALHVVLTELRDLIAKKLEGVSSDGNGDSDPEGH